MPIPPLPPGCRPLTPGPMPDDIRKAAAALTGIPEERMGDVTRAGQAEGVEQFWIAFAEPPAQALPVKMPEPEKGST